MCWVRIPLEDKNYLRVVATLTVEGLKALKKVAGEFDALDIVKLKKEEESYV